MKHPHQQPALERERGEKDCLGRHIVNIETVDKMTNPQIAAKVREYFVKKHSPTN